MSSFRVFRVKWINPLKKYSLVFLEYSTNETNGLLPMFVLHKKSKQSLRPSTGRIG